MYIEEENEYLQEAIVDLKKEKAKCKTTFTRSRRSLLVMLQQTDVTIDQIDDNYGRSYECNGQAI